MNIIQLHVIQVSVMDTHRIAVASLNTWIYNNICGVVDAYTDRGDHGIRASSIVNVFSCDPN